MSVAHPTSDEVVAARRPGAGPAGAHPAGPAGTRPKSRTTATAPTREQRITALAWGFVALFLEVESGWRPRAQLAPFMTPMLYARLSEVWVRAGMPGSVVQVRVAGEGPAGVDLVAVVRRGPRCGAVALRMARTAGGWLVDDVALPELGPLPLPAYPVPADEDEPDGLGLVPRVDLPPDLLPQLVAHP